MRMSVNASWWFYWYYHPSGYLLVKVLGIEIDFVWEPHKRVWHSGAARP